MNQVNEVATSQFILTLPHARRARRGALEWRLIAIFCPSVFGHVENTRVCGKEGARGERGEVTYIKRRNVDGFRALLFLRERRKGVR